MTREESETKSVENSLDFKIENNEKDKETVQPTVINDDLIKNYQLSYNRENKIFEKDKEPIWNLTHLALSYKNIWIIDNLKGMEKLQKLQLDNNIIQVI